jgi:hypothetical protein
MKSDGGAENMSKEKTDRGWGIFFVIFFVYLPALESIINLW